MTDGSILSALVSRLYSLIVLLIPLTVPRHDKERSTAQRLLGVKITMPSPFSDDEHLLLITLAVTVVFQLSFFVVAFGFKFDKVRSLLVDNISYWWCDCSFSYAKFNDSALPGLNFISVTIVLYVTIMGAPH